MKKSIEKMIKDGKFGYLTDLPKQEFYDSGSMILNHILGGGFPGGKIVEIFGPPSSGKSLIATYAASLVTQQKKYVIYCDLEKNYITEELNDWRIRMGTDMNYVITKNNAPAEEVIDDTIELLKELGPQCGMMVVDSIGVLTSGESLKKKAEQKTVATEARLIRNWIGKIFQVADNPSVIFLNHTYAKIGSYVGGEETKGGGGVKFGASIRLRVSGKRVMDSKNPLHGATGQEMTVFAKKNKIAAPERTATLRFDFGNMQYDRGDELLVLAESCEILVGKPPFFSYDFNGEERKFKGREALREHFREDQQAAEYILNKILTS